MPGYAALLRAVNVGGTGKLAMADLRALCQGCGLADVQTYIQSGNVVFRSPLSEAKVKTALEAALSARLGRPARALIRDAGELRAIIKANPFPDAEGNRVLVLFVDKPPARTILDGLKIPGREQVRLLGREFFIHYPDGMGQSKLKVPLADVGTGRNLNTVGKLADLLGAIGA